MRDVAVKRRKTILRIKNKKEVSRVSYRADISYVKKERKKYVYRLNHNLTSKESTSERLRAKKITFPRIEFQQYRQHFLLGLAIPALSRQIFRTK